MRKYHIMINDSEKYFLVRLVRSKGGYLLYTQRRYVLCVVLVRDYIPRDSESII